MRNPDLIPQRDSDFNLFQITLMNALVANHLAWKIPQDEITRAQSLQAAWNSISSISRANRTPAQNTARKIDKKEYMKCLRLIIQRYIRRNTELSEATLVAIGIKPVDRTRKRIPFPATVPSVVLMPGFIHKVRVMFRQEAGADGVSRRAMPKGVRFCEIAYSIEAIPVTADHCPARLLATRSDYRLCFTQGDSGKRLYVFTRWLNARGEGGSWTDRTEVVIP